MASYFKDDWTEKCPHSTKNRMIENAFKMQNITNEIA